MRKDFVSSVSHDLRTPLGIISGYAEGLRDGIVSGKVFLCIFRYNNRWSK